MSKAVVVTQTGGPEVMQLTEQEVGEPGAGQVRIRVGAAGVNFIDTYFRSGLYPRPLPFVNGLEGAGTVNAVGAGVTDLAVGDAVAWSAVPGSYAEEVIAAPAQLIRVPASVPLETAAAAMLQGMTAHYLVHGVRNTSPGDVALVHAAAGGTGLLLVQMLKRAGAIVYGTVSSDEKEALARNAGADEVIRYDRDDFANAVRDKTGGRGADVVYDGVGRSTFEGSLRALRMRGLLVLFGQASGPVPPFELSRLNDLGSLVVTRPSLAHFIATRRELEERAGDVFAAIADGTLQVRIGDRFPLDRAPDAHRELHSRRTSGKLLLIP